MEFIANHSWLVGIIGAVVSIIGMFYVPFLRKLVLASLKALLTKEVLKAFFLEQAQKYVDSTETKVDDAWLKALRKNL